MVASAWEEKYIALVQWRRFHGHTCVPISNPELGSWVSKQRQSHKKGKLSPHKQEPLDSIGFTWSTSDADWDAKFAELCRWKQHHGHTMVPFNEGGLGWWSNTQRQSRRKGKLSMSREARLDGVDFVWNPSNRRARSKALASRVSKRKHSSDMVFNSCLRANPHVSVQERKASLQDIESSDCTSSSRAAGATDFKGRTTSAPVSGWEPSEGGQPHCAVSRVGYGPSSECFHFPDDLGQTPSTLRRTSAAGEQKAGDQILSGWDASHFDETLAPSLGQALSYPLHSSGMCQSSPPQLPILQSQLQNETGFPRSTPESSLEILNLMAM